MFSFSACHTLLGESWLFDYGVNCDGHDQGQALPFASLPPPVLTFASLSAPHKYNPRKQCEKILFMCETGVERTISKSKSSIVLLLVEPNTSEEVTLFHPFIQSPLNEFWDETFYVSSPLMIIVYLLNINPHSPLT